VPIRINQTLQSIGLANLLWNRVEVQWYLYFTCLLPGTERAQVDAIYRSIETGSRKRTLIVSVASQNYSAESDELVRVKALVSRTNDAAVIRNALVHGDYQLAEDGEVLGLRIARGGDHSKANKLGFVSLEKELPVFIETLKALISEVESLLPTPPAPLPGVADVMSAVQWVQLLGELVAADTGSKC
jgi:hypothetical protein